MKEAAGVAKHYVYRMDWDTGFAPNTSHDICTLSGCKKGSIERWATEGSWVVGIGGNNTGKPDKLIYAMEVERNVPYSVFEKDFPRKSKYLSRETAGSNVLISRTFYYLGDNALTLPSELSHLVIDRQGCKCVEDEDRKKLNEYLDDAVGSGVHGKPNNPSDDDPIKKGCK